MQLPPSLIEAFPPSNQRLIDLTRREIDDDMLAEIAQADYGCDAEKHFEVLRMIRETGVVPALGWHGGEVLGLIRWSNPENPNHKPGATGIRGHRMRAFACAVLLRSAMDSGSDGSDEATLAQCLGSTRLLGRDFDEAAARFLTWMLLQRGDWSALPLEPPHEDQFLFVLGLLVVACRLPVERVSDSILADAAELVIQEDEKIRRVRQPIGDSIRPPIAFGVSHGYWSPLAGELVENAARVTDPALRDSLRYLGEILQQEL